MDREVVALFDFDGTLTRRDTLPMFIRHASGVWGLLWALLSNMPAMIVLACAGWKTVWGIDASTTKERLLRGCFAHKKCEDVATLAREFASKIEDVKAPTVVKQMCNHIAQGNRVAIVSASADVWVAPWASRYGVTDIIATRMEIAEGCYTGKFAGGNCNGEEKVRRIREMFPREKYHLVAYGNSSGDYPMLRYAHEAYMCKDDVITPFK